MTDNLSPSTPEPTSPQSSDPTVAANPPHPTGTATAQPQVQTLPPNVLAQLQAQILAQQRGRLPNIAQPIVMGAPGIQIPLLAQVQQTMQSWQGPYPPPDAVEKYEKILPGTFNRFVTMAEENQAAQIEDNKRVQIMTHADQKRGNYLGFLTTALAMAGAIGCVLLGAQWIAAAFLSVPVLAVAKAFIESARAPAVPEIPQVPVAVAASPPTPTE